MFVDLETIRRGTELSADVVIVGAGPAGITLAKELERGSHRVILLEAGGERPVERSSLRQELELTGDAPTNVHDGRARTLGGASTLWAGQVMPLDELDFGMRPWVDHSGWPYSRPTLDGFYRRAEAMLGLPPSTYDAAGWPPGSPRPPDLGPDLAFGFSRFARTVDFARAFGPAFRRSVRVTTVLNAMATRLVLDGDRSRVEYVETISPGGNTARVRGRVYVVCCGAIETARLLLVSGLDSSPSGGGRPVGRYFQEHVHLKLRLLPSSRRRAEAMFNSRLTSAPSGDHRRARRVRAYPKVIASRAWQEQHGLLRVGADVCYATDRSPVVAGKALVRSLRSSPRAVPAAVAGLVGQAPQVLGMAWRTLATGAKPSEGGGDMFLSVQCENAPSADNRVTIGEPAGTSGAPRAVLHWRVGEAETATITSFVDTLAQRLEHSGVARVERPDPWPLPLDELAARIDVGHHHMGTARMHEDSRHGVVDANCRVHGIANLYAGGASVFPAGGFSNPTLTILALCMRLADHLRATLP